MLGKTQIHNHIPTSGLFLFRTFSSTTSFILWRVSCAASFIFCLFSSNIFSSSSTSFSKTLLFLWISSLLRASTHRQLSLFILIVTTDLIWFVLFSFHSSFISVMLIFVISSSLYFWSSIIRVFSIFSFSLSISSWSYTIPVILLFFIYPSVCSWSSVIPVFLIFFISPSVSLRSSIISVISANMHGFHVLAHTVGSAGECLPTTDSVF